MNKLDELRADYERFRDALEKARREEPTNEMLHIMINADVVRAFAAVRREIRDANQVADD